MLNFHKIFKFKFVNHLSLKSSRSIFKFQTGFFQHPFNFEFMALNSILNLGATTCCARTQYGLGRHKLKIEGVGKKKSLEFKKGSGRP